MILLHRRQPIFAVATVFSVFVYIHDIPHGFTFLPKGHSEPPLKLA